MAKVAFSKLKCKINEDSIPLQIGEEIIAVKQYLPIQEKLELIGKVIELAHMQDENYSNPVKAGVFRDLEIVFAYTNISFTDKQKEEPSKLYDLLYSSGVLSKVLDNIPEEEYRAIKIGIEDSISAVYAYQNSIFGILDSLRRDYSELDLDLNEITAKLTNPESIGMVRDILTKLN